jgi:DNA-binding YbaB/EbfC family protein
MLGKFGDMMGKLQEAKKLAEEIKRKLDDTLLTVDAAGGDIKVEITGNRQIRNIQIAPALQHGDKEQLEELLLTAINKAIEKADKVHEEEMKKAAGGLMPGLF